MTLKSYIVLISKFGLFFLNKHKAQRGKNLGKSCYSHSFKTRWDHVQRDSHIFALRHSILYFTHINTAAGMVLNSIVNSAKTSLTIKYLKKKKNPQSSQLVFSWTYYFSFECKEFGLIMTFSYFFTFSLSMSKFLLYSN